MESTNTHSYDTKLNIVKEELKFLFLTVSNITDKQKQESFKELYNKILPELSELERIFLLKLISEKDNYYDPINDLRVDELLYLCCIRILEGNVDFLNNFKQQLSDLKTGSCVQGRSIRLLQLIYAFNC